MGIEMTAIEESMLDDLLNVESGLTGKDMDFIESLDKQRDQILSGKQINWLEDLTERCL